MDFVIKSDNTLNDICTLISESWNLLNDKIDLSNLHQVLPGFQVDGDCLAVSFTALAFDLLVKSINSRFDFVEKIKPFLFSLNKEADKDIFIF